MGPTTLSTKKGPGRRAEGKGFLAKCKYPVYKPREPGDQVWSIWLGWVHWSSPDFSFLTHKMKSLDLMIVRNLSNLMSQLSKTETEEWEKERRRWRRWMRKPARTNKEKKKEEKGKEKNQVRLPEIRSLNPWVIPAPHQFNSATWCQ